MRPVVRLAVSSLCLLVAACPGGEPERERAEAVAADDSEPSGAATAPSPRRPVYEGDVRIVPEEGRIEAAWTIHTVVRETDPRELPFLLHHDLEVTEVSGARVTGHEVAASGLAPEWNEVTALLDGTAQPGDTVSVEIAYAGSPAMPDSRINDVSPDWVELGMDSGWAPIPSGFDEQLVATVRIDLPEGWRVVSSGRVRREDGTTVLHNDIPQADVAFVAAPGLEGDSRGRYTVFHRGEGPATVEAILDAADSCAGFLNDRFGDPEPLPPGRFVIPPRPDHGYARKNYVVLNQVDPDDEVGLTDFICHELAHFWSSKGNPMTVDNWLNEGFAEFVAALHVRERFGQEAFDRQLEQWRSQAEDQPPVWTQGDTARKPFAVNYRKAPLRLYELEQQLDAETFEAFLRRAMLEVSTTPELLSALEAVAGTETRARFEAALGR